jgi:hypothetical protein
MDEPKFTVFLGNRCLLTAPLREILVSTKERFDRDPGENLLIFEERTGRQVDFDLRGSLEQVLARAVRDVPETTKAGPGRPKLGVVSREISLMPRHWEWLEQQPNGISAAVRRLVEEARKRDPGGQEARIARENTYRFMSAVAGDLPDFEEASRALFAKDHDRFAALIAGWPVDIRTQLLRLLQP